MRLIDADALKTDLTRFYDGVVTAKQLIDEQPTVDAEPVRHAAWINGETCDAYDLMGVKTWALKLKCSNCGLVHKFIEAHMSYAFCPSCGAKMEGGNAELDE